MFGFAKKEASRVTLKAWRITEKKNILIQKSSKVLQQFSGTKQKYK